MTIHFFPILFSQAFSLQIELDSLELSTITKSLTQYKGESKLGEIHCRIGELYGFSSIPREVDKCLEHLRLAMSYGNAYSFFLFGKAQRVFYHNYTAEYSFIKKSASLGNHEAEYKMWLINRKKDNFLDYLDYLEKAANGGVHNAQIDIYDFLEESNKENAIKYMKCSVNNIELQLFYAVYLFQNESEEVYNVANHILEYRNDPLCYFFLAVCYSEGFGVEKNIDVAKVFYLLLYNSLAKSPLMNFRTSIIHESIDTFSQENHDICNFLGREQYGKGSIIEIALHNKNGQYLDIIESLEHLYSFLADALDNGTPFEVNYIVNGLSTGDFLFEFDFSLVLEYMQNAFNFGDPLNSIKLGIAYLFGQKVDRNFITAKRIFKFIIDVYKESEASVFYSYMEWYGHGMKKNQKKAEERLLMIMQKDDSAAAYMFLGALLMERNINDDYERGLIYLKHAVCRDNCDAIFLYGRILYETGEREKGLELFKSIISTKNKRVFKFSYDVTSPELEPPRYFYYMATEKNEPQFYALYATCKFFGFGCIQNKYEAIEYLKIGADKGDPECTLKYYKIVYQDDELKANEYFKKMCKLSSSGYKQATFELAKCYLRGTGCIKDSKESLQLFMRLYEQDNNYDALAYIAHIINDKNAMKIAKDNGSFVALAFESTNKCSMDDLPDDCFLYDDEIQMYWENGIVKLQSFALTKSAFLSIKSMFAVAKRCLKSPHDIYANKKKCSYVSFAIQLLTMLAELKYYPAAKLLAITYPVYAPKYLRDDDNTSEAKACFGFYNMLVTKNYRVAASYFKDTKFEGLFNIVRKIYGLGCKSEIVDDLRKVSVDICKENFTWLVSRYVVFIIMKFELPLQGKKYFIDFLFFCSYSLDFFAAYHLSYIFLMGRLGLERNEKVYPLCFVDSSINETDAEIITQQAVFYLYGIEVKCNKEYAYKLFEKAASMGSNLAKVYIGVLVLDDDHNRAIGLFKEAAENRNSDGEFFYGIHTNNYDLVIQSAIHSFPDEEYRYIDRKPTQNHVRPYALEYLRSLDPVTNQWAIFAYYKALQNRNGYDDYENEKEVILEKLKNTANHYYLYETSFRIYDACKRNELLSLLGSLGNNSALCDIAKTDIINLNIDAAVELLVNAQNNGSQEAPFLLCRLLKDVDDDESDRLLEIAADRMNRKAYVYKKMKENECTDDILVEGEELRVNYSPAKEETSNIERYKILLAYYKTTQNEEKYNKYLELAANEGDIDSLEKYGQLKKLSFDETKRVQEIIAKETVFKSVSMFDKAIGYKKQVSDKPIHHKSRSSFIMFGSSLLDA